MLWQLMLWQQLLWFVVSWQPTGSVRSDLRSHQVTTCYACRGRKLSRFMLWLIMLWQLVLRFVMLW